MEFSSQQNNPSQSNAERRKGKGRQRIAIEKIANETNRQVTFSKRRAGLFKKASELGTLCGAESAIVVFSPSEKAHSFGNPSVDAITDRFLSQVVLNRPDNEWAYLGPHNNPIMHHRNMELTNLEAQLEREKKHNKEEKATREVGRAHIEGPPNLDGLNYKELKQLKKSVAEFKRRFEAKIKNSTALGSNRPGYESLSGYAALFDMKPSINPNVGLPNNGPVAGNNPSVGFFPGHHGYVDPFDPTVGSYGFTFTNNNPHEGGGSGFVLPSYDGGFVSDVVTQEGVQRGTLQDYGQDQSQGFINYYGRGN
ncbi:Agamous-like MADS-box protein AGL62 [Striga hermonthica]|uniref:Agamous-like MADS-box protein AGL62 n=1 Tax=Striga hermonthica TaxID=68872 RepID=A0A9N7MII8_STRHE|nr:Agamous-like MADS-box protein AGL62 [Striga hermonthica]